MKSAAEWMLEALRSDKGRTCAEYLAERLAERDAWWLRLRDIELDLSDYYPIERAAELRRLLGLETQP